MVKNVSPGILFSLQMSFVKLGKLLKVCALVICSIKGEKKSKDLTQRVSVRDK